MNLGKSDTSVISNKMERNVEFKSSHDDNVNQRKEIVRTPQETRLPNWQSEEVKISK